MQARPHGECAFGTAVTPLELGVDGAPGPPVRLDGVVGGTRDPIRRRSQEAESFGGARLGLQARVQIGPELVDQRARPMDDEQVVGADAPPATRNPGMGRE